MVLFEKYNITNYNHLLGNYNTEYAIFLIIFTN